MSLDWYASAGNAGACTTLRVVATAPGVVELEYESLPGNQPATFANLIAVWAGERVRFTEPSRVAVAIPSDEARGTLRLQGDGISEPPFIAGYAVGPAMTPPAQLFGNVCASVVYNNDGKQTFFSAAIGVISPGALAIRYELPPGATPGSNGAWIAVWQGAPSLYYTAPRWTAPIESDAAEGTVHIPATLPPGSPPVTLGLFTSGWNGGAPRQFAAAAVRTFTI